MKQMLPMNDHRWLKERTGEIGRQEEDDILFGGAVQLSAEYNIEYELFMEKSETFVVPRANETKQNVVT